jgi:hypothetical protein
MAEGVCWPTDKEAITANSAAAKPTLRQINVSIITELGKIDP